MSQSVTLFSNQNFIIFTDDYLLVKILYKKIEGRLNGNGSWAGVWGNTTAVGDCGVLALTLVKLR